MVWVSGCVPLAALGFHPQVEPHYLPTLHTCWRYLRLALWIVYILLIILVVLMIISCVTVPLGPFTHLCSVSPPSSSLVTPSFRLPVSPACTSCRHLWTWNTLELWILAIRTLTKSPLAVSPHASSDLLTSKPETHYHLFARPPSWNPPVSSVSEPLTPAPRILIICLHCRSLIVTSITYRYVSYFCVL